MLLDNIVTDRQPQASTASLCSKERIEYMGQGLVGDKRAGIIEIHTHTLAILAGAQRYGELASLIRLHRFHGVQAQVNENLF